MAVLLCLEKEYGARCEKDIERLECLTFIIFDGYPAVFLTELGIGRNPERIVVGVFLCREWIFRADEGGDSRFNAGFGYA